MPDYSKAKIYRVYCDDDEYIGSTTRQLSERMNQHRCAYKGGVKLTSRVIFEKHGVENCKIELIEDYPCERREQLNRREGEIQRVRTCINKNIAGRTREEWRTDNAEANREYYAQYAVKNKEAIKERARQYWEENAEIIKEKRLQKKALII